MLTCTQKNKRVGKNVDRMCAGNNTYLNNRGFLLRNYRLIVALWKYDVLKKILAQEAKLRWQVC